MALPIELAARKHLLTTKSLALPPESLVLNDRSIIGRTPLASKLPALSRMPVLGPPSAPPGPAGELYLRPAAAGGRGRLCPRGAARRRHQALSAGGQAHRPAGGARGPGDLPVPRPPGQHGGVEPTGKRPPLEGAQPCPAPVACFEPRITRVSTNPREQGAAFQPRYTLGRLLHRLIDGALGLGDTQRLQSQGGGAVAEAQTPDVDRPWEKEAGPARHEVGS